MSDIIAGRRLKILRVTRDLLIEMFKQGPRQIVRFLGMPDDAKLVGASEHLFFDADAIAFKIESESFPKIESDYGIPEMSVTVHAESHFVCASVIAPDDGRRWVVVWAGKDATVRAGDLVMVTEDRRTHENLFGRVTDGSYHALQSDEGYALCLRVNDWEVEPVFEPVVTAKVEAKAAPVHWGGFFKRAKGQGDIICGAYFGGADFTITKTRHLVTCQGCVEALNSGVPEPEIVERT